MAGGCNFFFERSTGAGEYVIEEEGTARRGAGGTVGADARSSEGTAGSRGCSQESIAARNLVDATKEAEETSIAAVTAAALSATEEAQASLRGSTDDDDTF
jgi:hypothetical protein